VPAPTPAFEDLARQVARGQRSLHDAVDQLKRDAITAALDETDGNWAEAARRLGMNRSNLHHMAQRLRAQRPPR
jgi:transcriptional regulator with GAF, ATPase, and Fis domain